MSPNVLSIRKLGRRIAEISKSEVFRGKWRACQALRTIHPNIEPNISSTWNKAPCELETTTHVAILSLREAGSRSLATGMSSESFCDFMHFQLYDG